MRHGAALCVGLALVASAARLSVAVAACGSHGSWEMLSGLMSDTTAAPGVPQYAGGTRGQGDVEAAMMPPMQVREARWHHDRSPGPSNVFPQRYIHNASLAAEGNAPVMLIVGGEMDLAQWFTILGSQATRLAEAWGAHVLGVEHRYFGLSYPDDGAGHPFSTEALSGNLTINAAIDDLVDFVAWAKTPSSGLGIAADAPVILLGCSYSGVVAAFAGARHPQAFAGVVANSAPINSTADFAAYNLHAVKELGDPVAGGSAACETTVRDAFSQLVDILDKQGPTALGQSLYSCTPLTSAGDAATALRALGPLWIGQAVQYANVAPFCYYLERTAANTSTALEALLAVQNVTSREPPCYHIDEAGFVSFLQGDTRDPSGAAWDRQYFFLSCAEFGGFHTCNAAGGGDSSEHCAFGAGTFNLEWFDNLCKEVFHDPSVASAAAAQAGSNLLYKEFGGNDAFIGHNVLFVNGGIDEWAGLSVTKATGSSMPEPIFVADSGHCSISGASYAANPPDWVAARAQVAKQVGQWIKEFKA